MNVQRQFSTSPYERELVDKLLQAPELMNPTQVVVEDRSGGCGANFYIMVESKVFQGMPRIKQHRTVQLILKDEIAKWHAVSIDTKVPDRK
jgi:stress-induced morphogen